MVPLGNEESALSRRSRPRRGARRFSRRRRRRRKKCATRTRAWKWWRRPTPSSARCAATAFHFFSLSRKVVSKKSIFGYISASTSRIDHLASYVAKDGAHLEACVAEREARRTGDCLRRVHWVLVAVCGEASLGFLRARAKRASLEKRSSFREHAPSRRRAFKRTQRSCACAERAPRGRPRSSLSRLQEERGARVALSRYVSCARRGEFWSGAQPSVRLRAGKVGRGNLLPLARLLLHHDGGSRARSGAEIAKNYTWYNFTIRNPFF